MTSGASARGAAARAGSAACPACGPCGPCVKLGASLGLVRRRSTDASRAAKAPFVAAAAASSFVVGASRGPRRRRRCSASPSSLNISPNASRASAGSACWRTPLAAGVRGRMSHHASRAVSAGGARKRVPREGERRPQRRLLYSTFERLEARKGSFGIVHLKVPLDRSALGRLLVDVLVAFHRESTAATKATPPVGVGLVREDLGEARALWG